MTETLISNSSIGQCFFVVLSFIFLVGCSLPSLENRSVSKALDPDKAAETDLGKAISSEALRHSGKSGIYPLENPHDAFAARMLLAQAAQRTLDVQYYIWRGDTTGTLLLEALHAAAEKGVRVRLLLDDHGTRGLDFELAALNSHPNIEVRLFNPFVVRWPRWIGFLTDFSRANRRMHNKSFTADNQATIVGGRNVGDEYFGATSTILFADLDVLCAGPVVRDVSDDFDLYWASESSYPAELILPPAGPDCLEKLTAAAMCSQCDPTASAYMEAIYQSDFIQKLLESNLELEWARTLMVSDDPAKGLGRAGPGGLLIHQLEEIIGIPVREMDLVSPYLVPTDAGVEAFRAIAERGVNIRILTNSMDATDAPAVNAGYVKYRKALLKTGVQLYEMRRMAGRAVRGKGKGPFGSSGSSLHAKTFSVDGRRVFVGSLNFDPRSANLNTELGFVIDSPGLAGQIENAFDDRIPASSYEVCLDENGNLYWLEQHSKKQIRHQQEPNTGLLKRAWTYMLSLLPIEWLL